MALEPFEALEIIYKNISFSKFEIIPIEDASGRICAENINAKYFLPRFDNSAMDGYSVNLNDAGKQIKVIGKIFAGDKVDFN